MRGPPKATRGKCKRGRGGCESLRGRWVLAGASFGPMAAISRRGQGGRIYNNTRARVLLRRMCVKPAALTTHSPPKTFARPRTATRPPRTLPLPHAAPTPARRLRDAFPAEALRSPRSATPFPSTSAPPRSADARPQAARCIPRRRSTPAPTQRHALPEHFRSPTQRRRMPHAAPTHAHAVPNRARRLREAFPAATRCLSFRSASGTKKTAPHSACAMPNVSVDRRCGRSFGLVSRTLFAAVAGRWRVGVGLRPQPWALRSRRCGRVLRA